MYKLARLFFKFAKSIWLGLFLILAVAIVANLSVVQRNEFNTTILFSFLIWLLHMGLPQIIIIGSFIIFTLLTVIACFFILVEKPLKEKDILRKYLESVKKENSEIQLTGGVYRLSQELIPIKVPLSDIFISLKAAPDHLRSVEANDQRPQSKGVHQQDILDFEEQKHFLYNNALHDALEEQEFAQIQREQPFLIEDIVENCTISHPIAIILGTPGSGKSTCLRWLALQMSLRLLSKKYRLPDNLTVQQIPVLLPVGDYAKYITKNQTGVPSFQKFIFEYYTAKSPGISKKLAYGMKQGHCLFLFDGLDDVPDDERRRQVERDIEYFITDIKTNNSKAKQHNRFIVTSRVAGFEGSLFRSYPQYRLCELTDEEIKSFLTVLCPAIRLIEAKDENQAIEEGYKERDKLLAVFETSLSIKRLASNPFMLTILVVLQHYKKTLPHRRLELYEIITHTLLDDWNRDTRRPSLKISLAELILRKLALYCFENGRDITEEEVKKVVCNARSYFYQRSHKQSDDEEVEKLIKVIRYNSGLFIESGPDQFSFMHRTFQEYFIAQDILLKKPDEFQRLAVEHFQSAIWREPLLMAIAEKSKDRDVASNLLQNIVDTDSHDPILHRDLFFAATSVVDCGTWNITKLVQQNLANYLFGLYGDAYGAGRYTQFQKNIEEVMLQWLYEQEECETPLLMAWETALCTNTNPTRQKGAVLLLALLAPDIQHHSLHILEIIIPPLLRLAGLDHLYQQDLTCPNVIKERLSRLESVSRSDTLYIDDIALIVLYSFTSYGLSSWLHRDWLDWHNKQPELLERLTQHSLELDYLLTPAAIPAHLDDPNLDKQIELALTWKKLAQSDPRSLQSQLLQASNTVRYPHAYLFKRLLESELESPEKPWRTVWNDLLKKEMLYGWSAIYQSCLYLRLLIYKDNEQQCKLLINELLETIPTTYQLRMRALTTITSFHLREPQDWKFVWYLLNIPSLRELRSSRIFHDLQNLALLGNLYYLHELFDFRNLLDVRYLQELKKLHDPHYRGKTKDLIYLKHLRNMSDPNLKNPRKMIDSNNILSILCSILDKVENDADVSIILLTLYSILNYDVADPETKQHIQQCLEQLRLQKQLQAQAYVSVENRQLIELIIQKIEPVCAHHNTSTINPPQETDTPEVRVNKLQAIKGKREIDKEDVEEILVASKDARELDEDTWKGILKVERIYETSIEQFTRRLLLHTWKVSPEAQEVLVTALSYNDANVCTVAALLLQHASSLLDDPKARAIESITRILKDNSQSYCSLDLLDYGGTGQLDDILFETLQKLAYKA